MHPAEYEFKQRLIWHHIISYHIAVYAAISGASLSLLETGIDSLFDVGSNFLLFWLHRKAARLDVNKWPVGGARVETIGNIVYGMLVRPWLLTKAYVSLRFSVRALSCSLCCSWHYPAVLRMGSVNLVVIVESARSLIAKPNSDLKEFHLPSILAVAVALGMFSLTCDWDFPITVQTQVSKLSSSSTASRFVRNPVKCKYSGKIIGMIYSSMDLVGISTIVFIPTSHSILGILMSAGGSKLAWCQYLFILVC